MRLGWPLLSLAIAAFVIGTTELVPMGQPAAVRGRAVVAA